MFLFLKPRRTLKCRITEALKRLRERAASTLRHLPSRKYCLYYTRVKGRKLLRRARYLAEDACLELRRMSGHTDAVLFSAILVLASVMFLNSAGESVLNSLIALLLLVLVAVIYGELKLQRRMIRNYVPTIELVRIRKCQLYSDRIRARNIFGLMEKLDEVRKVRHAHIKYEIINDSFAPITIEGVDLTLRMKDDRKMTLPSSVSMLDIEPKRRGGNDVVFRLKDPVSFDSIEWLDLDFRGNCRKTVRIKPHLYVNAVLMEKIPKFILEPFEKFSGRPELSESGSGNDKRGTKP